MTLLIASIALLLLSSATASCVEVALLTAPIGEVRSAVDQGRAGAAALLVVKRKLARPMMAIVILNNASNIVGSILVGALAADVLGSRWLGLFSGLLTLAVIVFAEIIPKTVGEQYPMRISLVAAPVVLWGATLLLPLIVLIEVLVKPLLRGRPITSESEIRSLTRLGTEHGLIERAEGELIQRVFRLNDVTAARIMTPAGRVDRIDAHQSVGALRELLPTFTHTRLPVVEANDLDKVKGIANVRDLLAALSRGEDANPVSAYLQPADIVPSTLAADDLMRHFQRSKRHLALVADEQGIVLGVVTLEDVVEELVGEIVDETDVEEVEMRRLSDGGLLVRTTVSLGDACRALQCKAPAAKGVGEWLLEGLGRIPAEGEWLELGGLSIRIADATPRKVEWVELRPVPPQSDRGAKSTGV